MTQAGSRNIQELAALVNDVANDLSAHAVATLVAHPDAVRSALAVAADALSVTSVGRQDAEAIGDTESQLVDAEEAGRRIVARTRPGGKETLLTSTEFAARVGLKTRQSVHDWLRRGKIVGWQGAKRGYVFPAGQLDESGRPLNGLDRIVPRFDDGYAAWVWLTTPRPSMDGTKPLARLRNGEIDLVATVVEGDAQGDFG